MKIRLIAPFCYVVALCASLILEAEEEGAPSTTKRELVLLNWSEYMDQDLIKDFEEGFQVDVREVYFESDEMRDDILVETDAVGYDIVVVNGATLRQYKLRDWLEPIDETNIPNLRHIDQRWMKLFPESEGFAVPFAWGTTGIAYRSDLLEKPITRWRQLFEPAEELKGKITLIKYSRDIIGMALKALGYSANSTDPVELAEVEKLLLRQKPYIESYFYPSLTEDSAMVTGVISAAMMFSGDALALRELNPHVTYVLPEEGGNIWVDYFTIIGKSANKDLALKFIEFFNQPANAARLAQKVFFATPNSAAEALLPEEFLQNPIIYPSKEALAKSEIYTHLPPSALKKRNLIFSKLLQ